MSEPSKVALTHPRLIAHLRRSVSDLALQVIERDAAIEALLEERDAAIEERDALRAQLNDLAGQELPTAPEGRHGQPASPPVTP